MRTMNPNTRSTRGNLTLISGLGYMNCSFITYRNIRTVKKAKGQMKHPAQATSDEPASTAMAFKTFPNPNVPNIREVKSI